MTDFTIGEDGFWVERSIHDLAAWYCQFDEAGNSLNYEAHVMLLRAYVSLVALTSGSGIPRARYNVLRILYQQPDRRLQMTDISVGLNVSATNITKVVHGLERDGLVRRVPHHEDKRRTWTEITKTGEAEFLRALPRVVQHTDEIWDNFSDDEKRILVHVLAKLRMLLQARDAEDALREFKPPSETKRRRT
ncbi:MAG TPA: MarR family transcriptional regulator [Dehalococcoidia bacterium]|nr:MarR family transcriptional regulator [Dehalococcoidia bacterium]